MKSRRMFTYIWAGPVRLVTIKNTTDDPFSIFIK